MPELPEVETVCRGLAPQVTGRTISDVILRRDGLRHPFAPDLKSQLNGQTVNAIRRRAKYIVMEMDHGKSLIVHLGMSGSFTIHQTPYKEYLKHDHIIMCFGEHVTLSYHDPRRFGMFFLLDTDRLDQSKPFSDMGPEPLGNHFHSDYLYEQAQRKSTSVKNMLMDQRVVAGLGNIYVCEACFLAHIHPARKTNSLTQKECQALHHAIVKVLQDALESGGSSLRDYRQTDGSLGYFQHSFSVYDREGKACKGCHCDITKTGGIVRMTQSGRSSFVCPHKQKQNG